MTVEVDYNGSKGTHLQAESAEPESGAAVGGQ